MLETLRAVVFPWHCDHYGHMNTRHYLGMFDDAGAHLMLRLGYSLERDAVSGIGWADVEQTIRYKQELRSGALVQIRSRPVKTTRTSIHYHHLMSNLSTGEECASMDGVVVCFNLTLRKSCEIPAAIVQRCIDYGRAA